MLPKGHGEKAESEILMKNGMRIGLLWGIANLTVIRVASGAAEQLDAGHADAMEPSNTHAPDRGVLPKIGTPDAGIPLDWRTLPAAAEPPRPPSKSELHRAAAAHGSIDGHVHGASRTPRGEEKVGDYSVENPTRSVAVGMGVTDDPVGLKSARVIPSFFATGGFGGGTTGFELTFFGSAAFGRYPSEHPVARTALGGVFVFRPLASQLAGDHLSARILRTIGGEGGIGVERDHQLIGTGSRFEVLLGARVEFPIAAANDTIELRLRVAVRRAFGLYRPVVGTTSVGDTYFEAYSALVTMF